MKDARKLSRVGAVALVATLGLLFGLYSLTPKNLAVRDASAHVQADSVKPGPHLQVEMEHDFKNVEQGTLATHTFMLKNVGTDTLHINSTRPSCGCTAALLEEKEKHLAPGEIGRLKVTYDGNNKAEGPFTKTITVESNSADNNTTVLRIRGTIVKSKTAHKASMMHLDGIFEGDCAKCHVEKGRGELGARLFDADCGVCHGSKADGKPGPELASEAMMKHSPKDWKKIIANGISKSNMPAFHKKNKGPLSDEEIESLVEYLGAYKKELDRNKKLKSVGDVTPAKK